MVICKSWKNIFLSREILQGPEIIVSALRPDTACLGSPQCFWLIFTISLHPSLWTIAAQPSAINYNNNHRYVIKLTRVSGMIAFWLRQELKKCKSFFVCLSNESLSSCVFYENTENTYIDTFGLLLFSSRLLTPKRRLNIKANKVFISLEKCSFKFFWLNSFKIFCSQFFVGFVKSFSV